MSESNPYAPSASLPSDLNAIRKASINPFHLYQRGIELIGDQYWQFLFITLVAMLIGSAVPMGLLIGVMLVGVFTCFILREQGKRVEFADLFKSFDEIGPPLIASLIMTAVSTAVLLPFVCGFLAVVVAPMAQAQSSGAVPQVPIVAVLLLEALFFAAILLATLPFTFTFQLIADRRLTALEAVKVSAKATFKNFWGVLWFFVVNMFVTTVLTLFCFLPALFFLPVSMAAFFQLYRAIFPKVDAISDLGA